MVEDRNQRTATMQAHNESTDAGSRDFQSEAQPPESTLGELRGGVAKLVASIAKLRDLSRW